MSKKMIVRFVDGYEGRQDLIFEVNQEGIRGLMDQLLMYTEFPDDEMPVLKIEMFTEAQLDEANRIGKEMA